MKIICNKCNQKIDINPASLLGQKGGQKITEKKSQGSRANLEEARKKRWIKPENQDSNIHNCDNINNLLRNLDKIK